MTTHHQHYSTWHLAWGLFFILSGLLLLVDRSYLFSFGQAFRVFWPLGMIALGITRLLSRQQRQQPGERQDNVHSPSL
jgi:hypothetical protein